MFKSSYQHTPNSDAALHGFVSMDDVDSSAVITSYHNDQEIGAFEERSEYWYQVISGAARQYAVQPDGRRQIIDLLLQGDCFGFTAAEVHSFAAEAVMEGTVIASYPRRRLEVLADANPNVAHGIRDRAFDTI